MDAGSPGGCREAPVGRQRVWAGLKDWVGLPRNLCLCPWGEKTHKVDVSSRV